MPCPARRRPGRATLRPPGHPREKTRLERLRSGGRGGLPAAGRGDRAGCTKAAREAPGAGGAGGQNAFACGVQANEFRPGNLRRRRGGGYGGRMDPTEPSAAAPWRLFADGAARGNPGPAAAGFVLDDPEGRPAAAGGLVLGAATNNVAEYRALLAGLAKALELGVCAIEVRMDSELVVRQMTGVYRVKNEGLKPLFAEAQALSRRFERFAIRHVPRDQNARADAEANRALDAAARPG
jgi:ribonuclease HI